MPLTGPDILSLCLSGEFLASPESLWRAWSLAPQTAVPLALLLAAYLAGWALRSRGDGVERIRHAYVLAGWFALAVALLSPLCRLSATLFSAHMVQLMLLGGVAPSLLALGKPWRTIAALVPQRFRRRLTGQLPGGLTWPCTWAYGVALWLWHYPPIYAFALADPLSHLLGLFLLVSLSCLFWSAVSQAAEGDKAGRSVLVLLATMIHMGLLGAILTFARTPFYAAQTRGATLWSLTPLEDQQLGGLLMWIPLGLLYIGTAAVLGAAWLRRQEARNAPEHALRITKS